MQPVLEDKLRAIRPEWFIVPHAANATLQYASRIHFDCGDGWYDLLRGLILAIDGMNPRDFRVVQVKEKFGGLRFYIYSPTITLDDPIYELIFLAEKKSFTICEDCGRAGVLRRTGWIRTLCDEHANGAEPYDMEKSLWKNMLGQ